MGDDLYSRQPLCQTLLEQQFNFILVCRPESHPTMYEHLEGIALPTMVVNFDSWDHLLTFMIQGLELDLPPNSS